MVRVETNGWHPLGRWEPADDGRCSPIGTYNADIGTSNILKQSHDAACAALYLGGPGGVGTHRLDRDKRFQIDEDAWNLGMDLITQRHGQSLRRWMHSLPGGRDPDCLVRGTDASLAGQQWSPARRDLAPDSTRDLRRLPVGQSYYRRCHIAYPLGAVLG